MRWELIFTSYSHLDIAQFKFNELSGAAYDNLRSKIKRMSALLKVYPFSREFFRATNEKPTMEGSILGSQHNH